MIQLLQIFLFSAITMVGLMPLHAQEWEQVGWQGGEIQIQAQLGNTLYGKSGNGYYKSTDWGKTWILFRNGLPQNSIFYTNSGIDRSGDYVYINATTNYLRNPDEFQPGLYCCKENENSWTFKKLSSINGIVPRIISFSSDTIFGFTNLLYSNSDSSSGFYLSTDGGNSWQKRVVGLPFAQYEYPIAQGSIIIFPTVGGFYKTENYGLTWMKFNPHSGNIPLYGLSFINDSILISFIKDSTTSTLYRSNDYGITWMKIKDSMNQFSDITSIPTFKILGSKSFMICNLQSLTGTIYKLFISDNFGENWKRVYFLDSTMWFWDIYGTDNHYIIPFLKDQPSLQYSLTDSAFIILTPIHFNQGLSGAQMLLYVEFATLYSIKNFIYGSDLLRYSDSLTFSSDNGINWSTSSFLKNYQLSELRWVKDGTNLYAFGKEKITQKGSIFRSIDEGKTWVVFRILSMKTNIEQFFAHGDTIILKLQDNSNTPPNLFISIDDGLSWVAASTPFPYFNIAYSNSSLLLYDGGIGYAFSLDLGATWNPISLNSAPSNLSGDSYLLGNKWFLAKQYDGRSGKDYSIYSSKNQGLNWQKSNGLDSNLWFIPSFFEFKNGIFYAPGFPTQESINSLFYSRDSGDTWKQLGGNYTNAREIFIGSEYYFMTGGTELWRLPTSALSVNPSTIKNISSISINGCFPNPATSSTHISYSIPKRSDVLVQAFDVMGREVARITSGTLDAGSYDAVWDTKLLPAGSYIIRLTANGESAAKVVEVVR